MERLTECELHDGKVGFTKCSKVNCVDKCSYCFIPEEAKLRLREYEDIGLTPEQIQEINKLYAEKSVKFYFEKSGEHE